MLFDLSVHVDERRLLGRFGRLSNPLDTHRSDRQTRG